MQTLINELQAKITNYVDNGKIPSISIGIITNNQLSRCEYGFKKLIPTKEKIDANTIYDLASLSKVTGTLLLILKLIEEGSLSMEAKVVDYLSDFKYPEISIKNLLVHTSGLAADDKNYKNCLNKEEILDFICQLPLTYATDSKVVYSCFNYILLGFIIEKLKGNMESYADQVIFKPLNMNCSSYNPALKGLKEQCAATELTDVRGLIQGSVHDGKAYIIGGVAGNAGVFSTIEDLSHLALMMLNDGQYNGKTIFDKKTIELLKHCYTKGLNESRSLGWFFCDPISAFSSLSSQQCLYHTGFTGTSMYIDFSRNCAIIILTNRVHPTRENNNIAEIRKDLHKTILDYLDQV